MTAPMKAHDVAARAAELVAGDRAAAHGLDKRSAFQRIVSLWNAYLGVRRDPDGPITVEDYCHMMVLMKIARSQTGDHNPDDYLDACGYAACAGEVAHQVEVIDRTWVKEGTS